MATIFVDKLVNLDFTYFHLQRGLVGETLLVDFSLSGDQNDQGMVLDFGDVKRKVATSLEEAIDHKLVLPITGTHNQVKITPDNNHCNNNIIKLLDAHYAYTLSLPTSGFSALPISEITPETLSTYLLDWLQQQNWWNKNWQASITLSPEILPTESPYFHYTHGLPKHAGPCQRIAHGHRSKLQIFRNGEPDLASAYQWCDKWKDIYIGSKQDIVGEDNQGSTPSYKFAYTSQEGYYALEIPQARTYLIDSETTIENIAQHVAQSVASAPHPHTMEDRQQSATQITARVHEGYNKGAVGHALTESK